MTQYYSPSRARGPDPKPRSDPRWRMAGVILLVTLILALQAPDHGVILAMGVSLTTILALLWRRDEPPLILLPVLLQWSEVAVKPFLSGLNAVPINSLAEFGGDIKSAAYFGFGALVAAALGISITLRKTKGDLYAALAQEVANLPFGTMARISLSIMATGIAFGFLATILHPISQLLIALGNIGLAGLFAICFWCLKNRRGYAFLAIVMAVELVIGITGFFADFRAPVMIFCVAAVSARPKLKLGDLVLITIAIATVISIASFWSYVKRDYRYYVSGGEVAQVVTVPLGDRMAYMSRQLTDFNADKYGVGLTLFLKRQSYIDFLSNTMAYVPTFAPHENGARVTQVFRHVITPRFLFPNKQPLEPDTAVAEKYTGLTLYSDQATSISLGYLAELYIDFGYAISILCCFAGGLAYGAGFRALRDARGPLLLRIAVCSVFAVTLGAFGTALIKIVGGAITTWFSCWAAERYLLPLIFRVLRGRSRPRQHLSQPAPRNLG